MLQNLWSGYFHIISVITGLQLQPCPLITILGLKLSRAPLLLDKGKSLTLTHYQVETDYFYSGSHWTLQLLHSGCRTQSSFWNLGKSNILSEEILTSSFISRILFCHTLKTYRLYQSERFLTFFFFFFHLHCDLTFMSIHFHHWAGPGGMGYLFMCTINTWVVLFWCFCAHVCTFFLWLLPNNRCLILPVSFACMFSTFVGKNLKMSACLISLNFVW